MQRSSDLPIAATIPPEIISIIIEGAESRDLVRFALIHRTWTRLCQSILFSSIVVDPTTYHPVYDLVLVDSQLGDYIRSVWLKGVEKKSSSMVELVHPKFPQFLCALERVNSLTIAKINWELLSADAIDGLIHVFRNTNFKTLILDSNDSEQGFPLAFLAFCPNVRKLSFRYNDPSGADEVPPTSTSPPILEQRYTNHTVGQQMRVEDLRIEGCDSIWVFLEMAKGDSLGDIVRLDRLSKLALLYVDEAEGEYCACTDCFGCFLEYCGGSVVDLHLQVERMDEDGMGCHIQPEAVQALVRLRKLKLQYMCPDTETFSLDVAKDWFFSFLENFPATTELEDLQIIWSVVHRSSVPHIQQNMVPQVDEFISVLERLVHERFKKLRRLGIEFTDVWDSVVKEPFSPLESHGKSVGQRLRSSLRGVHIKVDMQTVHW